MWEMCDGLEAAAAIWQPLPPVPALGQTPDRAHKGDMEISI